jgi:membrane peptidoglycan carboxypeptidase
LYLKICKMLLLLAVVIAMLIIVITIREQPVVHALPNLVESEVHANGEIFIPLSQIPQLLQQAVIDTEDRSFYKNPGISFEGTGRSLIIDLLNGKYSEGGSTITQQLARKFFFTNQKTISRKLKEMILAVIITNDFSKQDILAMYLNSVYFGHGASGINAAARIFFNKPVADLNIAQCTLLAGLPQAPTYLDPLNNYQAARFRQSEVLQSMVEAGHIYKRKVSEIQIMPLGLR